MKTLTSCELLRVADGCIFTWESQTQWRSDMLHVDKAHTQQLQTSISVSFLLSVCHCKEKPILLFVFLDWWCRKGKVPTAKWFHMTSAVIVIWSLLKILFENSCPVGVCLNSSQGCPTSVTCVKCTLTYMHTLTFTAKQLPCSDVANFADDHNISSQFKSPKRKWRQMCRLTDTGSG